MTNISLAHRAEALVVRAALGILRRLAPATASRLGSSLAGTIGPLLAVSKVADRNLAGAMPALNAGERRRIVREVWQNLGATTAELARIGDLHPTASGPGFVVTGWEENVAPYLTPGAPGLILTGHFGNWEILPPAFFSRGIDLGFMYRAASNPLVDAQILRLREANLGRKMHMFPKGGSGARQAYAHLARGQHLAMLMDQKLDNGIGVPLFGRLAMTSTALASFALKFRCPVFPIHVVRIGPARLQVICEPPMTLPKSGDKAADIVAVTTEMNQILERWIREKPGGWLWLHRRWPKQP